MQKCPGQDTRYWTPEDVSEVECGGCGCTVEFFKTDGFRRCPDCGMRVINPAVSMGCAQWCQYARECLDFDPKTVKEKAQSDKMESVTGKIIAAVKRELDGDRKRISHAIQVLENAEKILHGENTSPRVTLAAALLHDIGIKEAEKKYNSSAPACQEREGPPVARRILEDLGFSEADIAHICNIVAHHHSGMQEETPEFRVVWDADWLVNFRAEYPRVEGKEKSRMLEKLFKTDTGLALACNSL